MPTNQPVVSSSAIRGPVVSTSAISTAPQPSTLSPQPTTIIEARSGWRLFDWGEIVQYRDLLYFLVLRDVTVLYKQTVLGIAWAVLTPFFSMVVFTIIFGLMLKVLSQGKPYALFNFAAL